MNRYVALLRGINVGGKNKLVMAELKKEMITLGFTEVVTYLNSGNLIFFSDLEDKKIIATRISNQIKSSFQLDIPVYIILQNELKELLEHAPNWWDDGDKEIYDNLIFILPPLFCEKICEELGEPNAAYEKVFGYEETIFWSFIRKEHQKTNWWSRTARVNVKNHLTIRTANTIKKIVTL